MKPTLICAITFSSFSFQSCQDNDDTAAPINQSTGFYLEGLNQYYLWQPDVPNLSDDRFASQDILNVFLKGYPVPEELFDALRVDKSIDRFSWIVDDYLELEGALSRNQKDWRFTNPGSTTDILDMFVTSSRIRCSNKDINVEPFFYGINGTQLTISNYQSLLMILYFEPADYNSEPLHP
jgi:hypothetical protein